MTQHEYETRRAEIRREIQAAIRDMDWARMRFDLACDELRDLVRARSERADRG